MTGMQELAKHDRMLANSGAPTWAIKAAGPRPAGGFNPANASLSYWRNAR